jgi:hypothetical protein
MNSLASGSILNDHKGLDRNEPCSWVHLVSSVVVTSKYAEFRRRKHFITRLYVCNMKFGTEIIINILINELNLFRILQSTSMGTELHF